MSETFRGYDLMKHAMMDDSDDAAWGWHRAISPGLEDTLLRSDLVFFFL